jgi:small subunit ribosomal protein S19e
MTTVHDVNASRLVSEASKDLKKVSQIKSPEWIDYVKTGAHKERPSDDSDFWYKRSASILRTLYTDGVVGVSKLRTKYGGRKNRGAKPDKFYKGSGSIIRKILQQLEQAELVAKDKKGRVITPKGKSLLDKAAARIKRKNGKK